MPRQKLRILAFGAHADDLEILCAGTLARWADQGHQLVMATATWCKFGCCELSLEECSKIRHAEPVQYFDFDILEQVETVARYRGIQAGVRYAEAFRRHSEAGWGNLTLRHLP